MNRALVNAPYTLEATVFAGTTPTDPSPDSATVTVLRADGTAIITAGATNNTGTGTFARTLTSAQMALLDTLTAEWTMTVGSETTVLRTHTEVVGGFLCTLGEIKALFPTATDAEAAQIRTAAEQRLESVIGAQVPRYAYETKHARSTLRLDHGKIRTVRSLSVDGTAYAASTIEGLVLADSVVYLSRSLGSWYASVTIGYEYGEDYPSEVVREAVKLAARETFTTTSDGRVVRREADGQAVTYASPSSTGGFMDPTLRAMVADLAGASVG
jgi:Ca2+-binding RTX toxin-like protein